MEVVKLYRDGGQICAIIGDMPTDKACGFGDTPAGALRDLAADVERRGTLLDVTEPGEEAPARLDAEIQENGPATLRLAESRQAEYPPVRNFPGGGDIDVARKWSRPRRRSP